MKNAIIIGLLVLSIISIGAKVEDPKPKVKTQFALTATSATDAANQINSWSKRGWLVKTMTTQLVHVNRTDCDMCGGNSEREYVIVVEK